MNPEPRDRCVPGSKFIVERRLQAKGLSQNAKKRQALETAPYYIQYIKKPLDTSISKKAMLKMASGSKKKMPRNYKPAGKSFGTINPVPKRPF